jgi:hypothetical protein
MPNHSRTVIHTMRLRILATAIGLLALASSPSWAALGGDAESIRRDHRALGAADLVTLRSGYELHEAQTADGTRVRQYLDPAAGRVFAVTWQGSRQPRLGEVLGSFAPRYFSAANAHRGSHHVMSVSEPDFALTILRLPRGWQGEASVPGALPAGVDRREIR